MIQSRFTLIFVFFIILLLMLRRRLKRLFRKDRQEEEEKSTNIVPSDKVVEPSEHSEAAKTVSFKNLKKRGKGKKKASKVCKKDPISDYFSFSIRGFSDHIRDLKYLQVLEDQCHSILVGVQDQSVRVATISSLKTKSYEMNSIDFKDMYAEHVGVLRSGFTLDILIGTDESQKLRRFRFNLKTGKFDLSDQIVASQLHKHQYMSLDFLSSNIFLTCGSDQDTTMKLWSVESGNTIATVDTKKWKHFNQAQIQDMWTLATRMTEVVVYSLSKTSTIEKKAVLAGHKGEVRSVAFSSDALFLATSSIDSTLKFWNLATKSLIYSMEIQNHADCVAVEHLKDKRSAALEKPQDVKLIAALGEGESVRVFKISPFDQQIKTIALIKDAVIDTNIHFMQFTVDWDSHCFCLMVSGFDGRVNVFEVDPWN